MILLVLTLLNVHNELRTKTKLFFDSYGCPRPKILMDFIVTNSGKFLKSLRNKTWQFLRCCCLKVSYVTTTKNWTSNLPSYFYIILKNAKKKKIDDSENIHLSLNVMGWSFVLLLMNLQRMVYSLNGSPNHFSQKYKPFLKKNLLKDLEVLNNPHSWKKDYF